MADLTFSQPVRRNLVLPVGLALAVLAAAIFLILRFTPHRTADVAVIRTAVYPSHLVFKSSSIVLNSDQVQDDIYVLTTLSITNHLRLPIFLKDFTASLIPGPASQSLPLTSSAIEKPDVATLFATFPAIKKLADAQGSNPLYRETRIDPGQTVQGYIVLHFPGTETLWTGRQDATVSIELYHQAPLTIGLPNPALSRGTSSTQQTQP